MSVSNKKKKYIKRNYPNQSVKQLAESLSLTIKEVEQVIEELGLEVRKAPRGSLEQKAEKKLEKPSPKSPFLEFLGKKWLIPLGLVLLILGTLGVYWPSFQGPFQFDDVPNIVTNNFVHLEHLTPRALFYAGFQNFKQNRPLSNLSFGLNYYFHRTNPFGYHLVNFFFHLLSGICLWLILERIFARRNVSPGLARLLGWLSALLWMVHPINTQAVTYIVQRHSSMAGAFSLLGLLFYDLARSNKKKIYYVLSAVFGIAGMMCKETALVMPVLVFIYELWFLRELKPEKMKKVWRWLWVLLAFYILVAVILFSGRKGVRFGSAYEDFPFSPVERTLSQGRILLWYASLVIFPASSRQCIDHNFIASKSFFEPLTTLPAYLVVLGLIALALLRARRYPLLSFSILWYFGQLSIESLPLPIDLTFEHRLYLASIPILAFIPFNLFIGGKRFLPGLVLIFLLASFFGALTYKRNQLWLSRFDLWRDTVLKAPFSYRAEYNLANEYYEKGEKEKAVLGYQRAIIGNRTDWRAHFNLARTFYDLGQWEEAIKEYQEALKLKPKQPENVHNNLGYAYQRKGDWEKAIDEYQKALKINPDFFLALKNLGNAYLELGRCDEAWQIYYRMDSKASEGFVKNLQLKCPR